jgi:hypothetical protein
VRSLAVSVAQSDSAPAVAARAAWAFTVQYATALLGEVVQPFWNGLANKMSGYNRFIQQNRDSVSDAGVITYTTFRTTIGDILRTQNCTVGGDASADTITTTWTNNGGTGNALDSDTAIIVVHNRTQDYWIVSPNSATRVSATDTFTDTQHATNDVLDCWLSFQRAGDDTQCSIPRYDEGVVVA